MNGWVVFLGPCLPLSEAKQRFPAGHFVPPIRRGDIPRLMEEGWRRFAIVDGEFAQSLSVSLVELREAIRGGAWIAGASSMGALRAAEGYPLGVHGVGWIYEAYREGRIESDEDVALVFDQRSHRPLSIPLINLRWVGCCALEDGILSAAEVDEAIVLAAAIPYWERSPKRLRSGDPAACRALQVLVDRLEAEPRASDRKALDCIQLLDELRRDAVPAPASPGPPQIQYAPADPPSVAAFVAGDGRPKHPGTHRLLPSETLLQRAWHDARLVGVTRLADLTALEPLGSYSYSSTRPWADDGDITVTGGKGSSRAGARVGALLEAMERAALSCRGRTLLQGTIDELAQTAKVLHPHALVPELGCTWEEPQPLAWWPMRDLATAETILVPASAVFFPPPPGPRLFPSSSGGTAVGATLGEATLYALLEVMERDLAAYARWFRDGRPLDLATVTEPSLRARIDAVRAGGLDVHCWVVFNEYPLPLFYVVVDDPATDDATHLSAGQATHPCPNEALGAALGEAVYSRLTRVSGGREDLAREAEELAGVDVHTMRQHALQWTGGDPLRLSDLPDRSGPTIEDDLRYVLDAFASAGLRRVLVADISVRDGLFHAVRAVVPGVESGITMSRVGPRLLRWLKEKPDRFQPFPSQPTTHSTLNESKNV